MSGLVVWITGLPGSGKSTVAEGVKARFPGLVVLRMDEFRKAVTPAPTYSEEERDLVYRALVSTAKTLAALGHTVIIDATGNLRKWRDLARQLCPRYAEVYLKCRLDTCAGRERSRLDRHGAPKDIYQKGTAGWPVPGLRAPYEEPLAPELTIDTEATPVEESVRLVGDLIAARLSSP